MSKLTDQYRTINVYNAHGFAEFGEVYIEYCPSTYKAYAEWQVIRRGYQTSPRGPWTGHGNKCFVVNSLAVKKKRLAEAQAWAGKRYGIIKWARTPFGTWMHAGFVETRMAVLSYLLNHAPTSGS